MEVSRITIHKIEKERNVNEAHVILSEGLIPLSENVDFLVDGLNKAFDRDEKVIKTEFQEIPKEFQTGVRNYSEEKTDQTFLAFTNLSINRIRDLLIGRPFATGGYFVFIDFTKTNQQYVGVFIVRDTERVIFDREPGENIFTINKTTVINTDKLAMASRVDLGKLNGNRYLHFTHKQSDISEYFVEWIEAELLDKSEEDSRALLDLINSISDFPIDPETDEPYEGEKFRNAVLDHIKSTGRVVRLRELSRSFWNDPDFIINYAEEKDFQINHEFQAVGNIVARLRKYEVKAGKIKLSFAKVDRDQGRIRAGDGNQIVIDSEELRRQYDSLNG